MSKLYIPLALRECFGTNKETKECRKCPLYPDCCLEYARKLVGKQSGE